MSGAFLTTGAVARAMGVTINTVKAWIRRGQVEAVRLPSGHYRIPASELQRLRGDEAGDLPAQYRRRLRQWEVAEAWSRSQPVEEIPIEQLLTWVGRMLDVARSFGDIPEPSVEETVERYRGMRGALAAVRE